jgi:hypothetical protein
MTDPQLSLYVLLIGGIIAGFFIVWYAGRR